MFDVIQNRRVLFGAGAIDRLGALLAAEHYRSVFVLAFRREAPCVQKTLEALEEARIPYVLDASLHGEPSTLDIDRIAAAARAAKPDAVLAVGGVDPAAVFKFEQLVRHDAAQRNRGRGAPASAVVA